MRISVRIASSGTMWHPRWPRIDLERCYNGEQFDEAEFRRQIAGFDYVAIGSRDWRTVQAFGAILIASVNDWMDDSDRNDGAERYRRIGAKLDRKLESDHVSFVRVDVTNAAVEWQGKIVKGAKVKITTDGNWTPQVQAFDRDFGMVIADFCRCYSERWERRGQPPLVFAPETTELIDELHERTRRAELADIVAKRKDCERYHGGYCAPCKFDCPCYKDGRCVEITI